MDRKREVEQQKLIRKARLIAQRRETGLYTKQDFFEKHHNLELGNCLRQWTVEEYLNSDYQGRVGVRFKTPNHPWMKINLTRRQAAEKIKTHLERDRIPADDLVISEVAPDQSVILQGEASKGATGILSTVAIECSGMRMREAMQIAKPYYGLTAHLMIKRAMDPASWDFLQELWNTYPSAVVEFATYEVGVGLLGWNTIFWEVRNY